MPTQRPFFANFLAAFRAQSALSQQSKASPPSSVSPISQPSHSTVSSSPSHPRSIATSSKTAAGATTTALTALHSPRAHSTSPLSHSPGPSSQSPYSNSASAVVTNENRVRRGSDSSSEGFRDVLSGEKWYIGGRTATGEERFFKLGVVRRHRSIDRLSLDRLSL